MNRFSPLRRLTVVLAALGLFALVVPRAAASEVPFQARGTFNFTPIGDTQADVYGSGHASPGGPFTFHDVVEATDDDGGFVIEGMITLVFRSGKTLTIYYEAPVDDSGFVSGPYWVVGGTGEFAGASGGGIIEYPLGQGEWFTLSGTLIR
jgi:hypothetical protein